MKKWIFILIVILGVIFIINYKYSNFDLTSSSSLSKETINLRENYYLGYGLRWNGLIKPALINVELRDADGSVLDQNHEQIEIIPFIDMQQHTGTLDELDLLEYTEKGYVDYAAVNEASINDNNILVLRIKLKDEGYINIGNTMILRYRILGIPKQQVIELNSFFHSYSSRKARSTSFAIRRREYILECL